MAETPQLTFHWADYLVFGITLLMSAVIGIYYAYKDRNQQTTEEFLMGNRSMNFLPVSISLLASFNSAIFITGISSEFYTRGIQFIIATIGQIINIPFAAHVFLPIYFKLRLTSVYEYLELRYKSKPVRILGSFLFTIQMLLYQAVVLYAPSLAVNAVTGLDIWIIMVIVAVVCTFYTTIGGLKAVIWTDVFQMVVMFGGMIAIYFLGVDKVGGFSEMWARCKENGRIDGIIWDPDPTIYQSVWSMTVGYTFYWLAFYGVNQVLVQRYCSMPTLRDAQKAIYINMFGLPFVLGLCGFTGLVMYAYYVDCDPLVSGQVAEKDQLLPLFVMEVLGFLHGIPGLFMAALFSGGLSTISSGLNSLAAVTWEDGIKPFYGHLRQETATRITKALAMLYGCISLGLAFIISGAEGVVQVSILVNGTVGGPLLGVFLLGMLFPWSNAKGAFVGTLTAFIASMWLGLGATYYADYIVPPYLDTSVEGCPANMTLPPLSNETLLEAPGIVTYFYKISYLYYTLFGVLITISIGMLVSLMTGLTKVEDIDPDLILPIFNRNRGGDVVLEKMTVAAKYDEEDAKKGGAAVYVYENNAFTPDGSHLGDSKMAAA